MPNDFTTIQNNQSSEKFYLIRLNPRRVVNDLLSSIGGGQYEMTFSYPISYVSVNGVDLTEVTSVSNPGEWSYDESTYTLTVYSTPSDSNIIIVGYYLFYTGGRHRVVYEDPENSSTVNREWLPRIKNNPIISNTIENVIQGNLSVTISSLIIINDQHEFENYLTVNDSFNLADIKIWLCLDRSNNIQKIYDGKITHVSIENNYVTFTFENPLTSLLEPAFLGDESDEAYFTLDSIPNLDSNYNNYPIPYIFGTSSRYILIPDSTISLSDAQKIDPSSLYIAVNINYSNTISTTTNREWGLCRVSEDGFVDFSFIPSNIDNTNPNYTRIDGSSSEIGKFLIGDTIVATQSTVDYYLRIIKIDRINNYIYATKEASISTGAAIGSNDCPCIIITNDFGDDYYLLYGRDYYATVTTTGGGNKYLKITLIDNFEANVGLSSFDIGNYKVRYRVRPDTSSGLHGSIVKKVLETAGLTVNISSITSANTALAVNCAFSIPQFDEVDFKRYLDYLQDILSSTLGYITLNNDFEFEYNIFEVPSSTNEVTDVDIIKNSYSVDINYQDIIHQIIAYNPHFSNDEATANPLDTPSKTETSLRSKYLHNINKTIRFRHVLESMNSRLPKILAIRSNRYAIYDFKTKIINIDNILGDDIKLIRNGILGNDSYKELKILALSKSPKETKILASDLYNLI